MSAFYRSTAFLGACGVLLATLSALVVNFASSRLHEPLLAFGDALPAVGVLLVSSPWLAWLLPFTALLTMLVLRTSRWNGPAAFAAGVLSVVIALAWVGFGALLPLANMQATA